MTMLRRETVHRCRSASFVLYPTVPRTPAAIRPGESFRPVICDISDCYLDKMS